MAGMEGKVCVITGATSGIGLITAERLAAMGARLVLVGRDPARGEAAVARIRGRAPRTEVSIHYADLSRLDALRTLASGLNSLSRIDVLINNAGAMFWRRQVTADGLERTFALNHMAYFVLTALLRDKLVASSPARIVNVASEAHRGARLDFGDLQSKRNYSGMRAYSRSKLCNILFTRELAKRAPQLHANCFHPGTVRTGFGKNDNGIWKVLTTIGGPLFRSPERGARSLVWLATSEEGGRLSGEYIVDEKVAKPSAAAQDDDLARGLWERSSALVGLPADAVA
jgi:NAD(P)-dependent dehydrogenase (short-subunit alcohol dehydrogenase family)